MAAFVLRSLATFSAENCREVPGPRWGTWRWNDVERNYCIQMRNGSKQLRKSGSQWLSQTWNNEKAQQAWTSQSKTVPKSSTNTQQILAAYNLLQFHWKATARRFTALYQPAAGTWYQRSECKTQRVKWPLLPSWSKQVDWSANVSQQNCLQLPQQSQCCCHVLP